MPAQKGNILLPLISAFAIVAIVAAGYFFYQNQQLEQTKAKNPTSILLPSQKEITSWKIFSNSKFGYSLQAPSFFITKTCPGNLKLTSCDGLADNDLHLYDPTGTIVIEVFESSGGALTGNATLNEYIPVTILNPKIEGKYYPIEQYYDNYSKEYVFAITNEGGRNLESGVSKIQGRFAHADDAKLVSQILSTFKFL